MRWEWRNQLSRSGTGTAETTRLFTGSGRARGGEGFRPWQIDFEAWERCSSAPAQGRGGPDFFDMVLPKLLESKDLTAKQAQRCAA